jgi:DegV family protein with EDD domain
MASTSTPRLSSSACGEASSRRHRSRRRSPFVLVDSLGASILQGLLVLKAAELAELGWRPDAIADELRRIRQQSSVFFTVDVFDNLLASGRVGRGQVMIAGLLDIRPILALGTDGRVTPIAKVRGRHHVPARLLAVLRERIPRDARRLRFGVVHVGAAERAASFAAELRREFGPRDVVISSASPVLATHLGPGAWGVAYQLED